MSTNSNYLYGVKPKLNPDGVTCLLQTQRVGLGDVCASTMITLNIVQGAFDMSFFNQGQIVPAYGSAEQNALDPAPCLSGLRSGITFEGPFLLYTVAAGSKERASPDDPIVRGKRIGEQTYLFDASQRRPIFLPYTGSLALITQYPGTWEFEWFNLFGARQTEVQSIIEPELNLSLRIASQPYASAATPAFREVNVPPLGSHSVVLNDSGGTPSIQINQETVPQQYRGPTMQIQSKVPMVDPFGAQGAFYTRSHLQNAQSFRFNLSSGTDDGFATFHEAIK